MENIIYKCPVCGLQLAKEEKKYYCDKNHSFDIAQEGYVNLILANQKKTKDPGDSKEMMESRKNFLNKGYYEKFSDKINEVIDYHLEDKWEAILDAGCGEGYFITRLKDRLCRDNICYYGIDISKSAVKYASKRDKKINFVVGSNFNLPIMDKSLDCIIRNFAPCDEKEFHRVLKDNGKLIIITPATEHLYELKELLYEKARKHDVKENKKFNEFNCVKHEELKYTIEVNNKEDIKNLISMTPYYWSITSEMRSKIDEIKHLITTLHFNIDVYRRVDDKN